MTPGEHILIVESDPDISDLIGRQALKPLGYQVTVVGDAASAVKTALQTPPDLLVANINLPGLSGKDLLAMLNSQGVKAPVVIIAEKGQEHDAIQSFRLGATDAIFWPLRDAEIVAIIERALKQTQEARERQKLDRQLKATNDELQRRLGNLTSILATGKAVVSITDQRQLLDRILESALQVAEAQMGWMLLRDEKTKAFLLRAHRNLPDAWAKKMNQPVDDGISSLVALSGEGLVMNGSALQKFKIAALGKSVAVIPIKIQNEVIGLLIVVRKNDVEITRDAQTLLEAIGDYASISLVNARLFHALEQTLETARASEKNRYELLQMIRETIQNEVKTSGEIVAALLNEIKGPLNEDQKGLLEEVKNSLLRLARSSENTVIPSR